MGVSSLAGALSSNRPLVPSRMSVLACHQVSQFQSDTGLKGDNRLRGVQKMESGTVIAILPCNDLDASERFYGRLGFMRVEGRPPEELKTYRILSNGKGRLHLTGAVEGWLVPGRNPFGLYFYMEDVDTWATVFRDEILGKKAPEDRPWGTYEFAVSDPDQTLVRVGWPSRLRKSPSQTA
jgi:catechol 2,3-dioxygenase-like lactoylglutathione lyase family enzyme